MTKKEIAILIFGLVVVVVVVVVISFSSTNSSSSSSSSNNGGGGSGGGTSNLGDNCLKNEDCRSTVCGGGKCVPSPGASCTQTLGDCTNNIPYKDFFCDIIGPVKSILIDAYDITPDVSQLNLPITVKFNLTNTYIKGASGCTGTVEINLTGLTVLKIDNKGSGYTSYGNSITFFNLPPTIKSITVFPEDLSVEVDGNGKTGKCVKH
jgi:hypothetical protein